MASHCAINVNKYIAKYDFDIASKFKKAVKQRKQKVIDLFRETAVKEILAVISYELTDDRKEFRSIWTLDGTPIRDLNDLPNDT